LSSYRYIHLATHGALNDRLPLQSAVILSRDHLSDPLKQLEAGQPVYDGRLTAEAVLERWDLHADLVTLSACETALGKYEGGEGFVGFTQALLLSGARSVCLSLWRVDDTATALLMQRLYANLLGQRKGLKKPLGKAEALAEASVAARTERGGGSAAGGSADAGRGPGQGPQAASAAARRKGSGSGEGGQAVCAPVLLGGLRARRRRAMTPSAESYGRGEARIREAVAERRAGPTGDSTRGNMGGVHERTS
jgi:hypothetical protein